MTQADLDAGHYANQACVDDGPGGAAGVCASRDVAGTATPAITLTKSAAPKTYEAVGQVITYTLVATNTGTVTLSNVSIADPKLGSLTCTPAQPTTLAPGAKLSCNGSHTIGQGDLDAGHYANTATATGTSPTGGVSVTASEDVTATPPPTPPVADANIQISPSAATNPVGTNHTLSGHVNVNVGAGFVNAPAGTVITFTITNAGGANATFVGASTCTIQDTSGSCNIVISSTAAGTTTVRGATDVTVNGIALHRETDAAATNSAAATKSWADATARTDILDANGNVVTAVQAGTIVHDKAFVARTAATPASLANPTGTVVFHRFTTGDCTGTPTNQTVTITVGNPSTAVSDGFAVTASMSYRADYSGDVTYPARAGACEPLVVSIPVSHPAIAIVKNPKLQTVAKGGTATFTITVTNTGDVALTNVRVVDALSPACGRTQVDIPALASMAPGAAVTYTCTRPNVQANFDNVAVATGTPPTGPDVTASDTAPVKAAAQTPPKKKPVHKVVKKPKPKTKPKVTAHKKPKVTG